MAPDQTTGFTTGSGSRRDRAGCARAPRCPANPRRAPLRRAAPPRRAMARPGGHRLAHVRLRPQAPPASASRAGARRRPALGLALAIVAAALAGCSGAPPAVAARARVAFQTDGAAGAALIGAISQGLAPGQVGTPVTAVPSGATFFAGWNGTGGFAGSSDNPLTVTGTGADQVITALFALRVGTTVALAATPPPLVAGQPVTFTATVAALGPAPAPLGGTVTFLRGMVDLGSAPVDAAGQASFGTTGLPLGTSGVTAWYGGDGHHLGSASASLPVAILPARPASRSGPRVPRGGASPPIPRHARGLRLRRGRRRGPRPAAHPGGRVGAAAPIASPTSRAAAASSSGGRASSGAASKQPRPRRRAGVAA